MAAYQYCSSEMEAKSFNDPLFSKRCVWVTSPLIIGAGPSGLAVAACLKNRGIPSLLLERSSCIASLWQEKTYDRLKLHLPKQFCNLPLMPFPPEYPEYPTKNQFIRYLEEYAERFDIRPRFNQRVVAAEFDGNVGFWKVATEEVEYFCRWLVVATGENADEVSPEIEGMEEFGGEVMHSSKYRNGERFKGKKVVVVGCGNSGMEVCLDLCNHFALPSLVVRDKLHVLPRETFGWSTFGLSMWLLKWVPIGVVDRILLVLAWLKFGNTSWLGLDRPSLGPITLKNQFGKTPVLDVGTLDRIKSGHIKVRPGIRKLGYRSVEFDDGTIDDCDALLLATGFKSNVASWLMDDETFSMKDGRPKSNFQIAGKVNEDYTPLDSQTAESLVRRSMPRRSRITFNNFGWWSQVIYQLLLARAFELRLVIMV